MRLLRNLLLGGLLLALAAAAAAIIWRLPLLETAGRMALARWGFEQADFTVAEAEWRRVTIEDASLGPGLPSVRRAIIAFTPRNLFRGVVDRIEMEGLHLLVEGEGENLQPLTDKFREEPNDQQERGSGGESHQLRALPDIMLTGTRVTLRQTALGDGTLALDGAARFSGEIPELSLQASLQTGSAEASLEVRTERASGGAKLLWNGEGALRAGPQNDDNVFAWLAAGKAIFLGSGELALTGNDAAAWTARLPETLTASGSIRLEEAQPVFAPEALTGRMNWQAEGGSGAVRLALTNEAPLTVASIPPAHRQVGNFQFLDKDKVSISLITLDIKSLLMKDFKSNPWDAALTVQPEAGAATAMLTAQAKGHGAVARMQLERVTLEAKSVTLRDGDDEVRIAEIESHFSGEIDATSPLSLNGKMEGTANDINASGSSLARLAARGPVRVRYDGARLAVEADGLALELANLALSPDTGAQGVWVNGTVKAEVPLLRFEDDVLTANLSASDGRVTVETGGRPQPVSWESIALDLGMGLGEGMAHRLSGAVTIAGAAVTIPDADIRLTGINATAPLGDGPADLDLTVSDEASPARFTPAAIRLAGKRKGASVTANGQASLAGGKALIPLIVEGGAADRSGLVRFGPAAISFAGGSLQPADLSPLLSQFEHVSGKTTISGKAILQPDAAPNVSLTLGLEEISATMDDGIRADGLSGTLTFPSLVPLATAGEQRLTLRRLVAGVPLDDVDAVFTIPPSADGLTVELSEAGATLAGGRIRAGHAVYRNGAADIRVGVSNLPLERLLAEWKVEGVEATGLISGSLPVAVRPDGAAIQDGKLSGTQSGTIRVDFGSARQTLSSAGEQVDLAVRTLENFHYTALDLDVSKPLDGELRIGVGLDGNNPDVLDGYPFRFNITLSGRLEPILEAIRAGERISTDLLRGSMGQ